MQQFYDVYIGKTKYKVYLKGQECKPVLEVSSSDNVYGELTYTFNSDTNAFHIKLVKLSPKAKYLLEHGYLCVAATTADMCTVYKSAHRLTRRVKPERPRSVYTKYRQKKYICRFSNADDERNEKHIKRLEANATELIFPISDICIPRQLQRRFFDDAGYEDAYVDVRFYLYSKRGCGRFCKTISTPFRIIKAQL